jgi:hypothetical protein
MPVRIFCVQDNKLIGGLESEINSWQESISSKASEKDADGFAFWPSPNIQEVTAKIAKKDSVLLFKVRHRFHA